MQLLQLAITSLTSLFTAVDGASHDNGPSRHGKTTCGDDKDGLK